MTEPRHPDVVAKELNDVNQLLQQHAEMVEKHPTDSLLRLSYEQFEYRKRQLLKELHLSLSIYFIGQVA
ncbi:hypothetical protein DR864_21230 [Runella rosea]|uniref:Uncharacterized protein n=1 Tax=Runella rosea TaxID=2259595 RepID=A0A344TN70_9BACT|nr:hypothetical protein [Runella rosea]AXE20091.1 hypothetical protein DR864_21230 [Runella rosea]